MEGTDPKCTDKVSAKDIKIELAFTTSWDKTQTIRFDDKTQNAQIKSLLTRERPYMLTLRYVEVNGQGQESESYTDFHMYKYNDTNGNNNNTVWSCNIPGDMRKNIYFILQPPVSDSSGQTYTFCYNTSNQPTLDRGANRLYVADDLDQVTGQSYLGHGHWIAVGDSDGAGHDDGGGFEGDDF